MGFLVTEEEWFDLTPQQQQEYEIIINDGPVTDATQSSDCYQLLERDYSNWKNLPCSKTT
jgi:hypothetical protein